MMPSPRYTTKTVACGYRKGTSFDDTPDESLLQNGARIKAVTLWVGIGIGAIEVLYEPENSNATLHGMVMGPPQTLLLDKDEYITSVTGSITEKWIGHLMFVTNKRTWGPFGTPGTDHFTWDAAKGVPTHLSSVMGLLAFSGYTTPYVHVLQATFGEVPDLRHREQICLEYEKITSAESSAPISKFRSILMSPTARLSVGPNNVDLYANAAIICQLPFFKAALQGGFRESLDRTINMPEDEPAMLTALIEFLYTGKYTYPHNGYTPDLQETPPTQIPKASLAEGIFHVGVCAVAEKYDCPVLKSAAYKNMLGVSRNLGVVDRLQVWTCAYSEGFRFPEVESRMVDGTERGRRDWVRVLSADHHAELKKAIGQDMQFALDLLRLATLEAG